MVVVSHTVCIAKILGDAGTQGEPLGRGRGCSPRNTSMSIVFISMHTEHAAASYSSLHTRPRVDH